MTKQEFDKKYGNSKEFLDLHHHLTEHFYLSQKNGQLIFVNWIDY